MAAWPDETRGCQQAAAPDGSERTLFAVALVASLAVLAAIAWPMFEGRFYTIDDLAWYHMPMRWFYARCLDDGTSFTWAPNVFCGYYIHGDGQAGMYHPLHWLLYRSLPFTAAFNIELILSYPLMLAGTYFLLRRWDLRRDASMFGAMVFAFSGFNLLHFMHMQGIATMAHIPWLLLAIDAYVRGGSRGLGPAVAIVLLTASEVLLGYPQYVWFSAVAAGLYVVLLAPFWKGARTVVALAALGISGMLVGAIQFLPTYDALAGSERWGSAAHPADELSLGPANFVQLVAPYLFKERVITNYPASSTHEYGLYTGAVTILLFLCLAAMAGRLGSRRRLAVGAAVTAVLAFLMATGSNGFLYPIVSKLPVLSWFRAPCRYIGLAHFGIAVGAAVAFQGLWEAAGRDGKTRRAVAWVLAAAVFASIAAVALAGWPGVWESWWTVFSQEATETRLLAFAGPALVLLAAAVVFAALKGVRAAFVLIIVFAAVDQAVYGLSYLRTGPIVTLASLAESVNLPKGRIQTMPLTDDLPVINGSYLVSGYAGLLPARALDYTGAPALRLAGASSIAVRDDTVPLGGSGERWQLESVAAPLGRARLVGDAIATNDPRGQVSKVNLDSVALVSGEVQLDGGPAGPATVTRDLPGDIAVTAEAKGRQLLVVSESFHGGWKAQVDGRPAKVIMAYGDFIGVVLDGGRHSVELKFQPESLRRGRMISGAGAVLAIFSVLLAVRGRRQG